MKFTVILGRPDYLCDDVPFGQDVYLAYVEADTYKQAVANARTEVFKADKKDCLNPLSKADYTIVVALEGHPKIHALGQS